MRVSAGVCVSVCFSVCAHADPSSVMRLLVDRQAAAAGRRRKQLPSLRPIICLVLITINGVRSTCCCHSDHRDTHCNMQDHEEPGHTRRTRGSQWSLRTLISCRFSDLSDQIHNTESRCGLQDVKDDRAPNRDVANLKRSLSKWSCFTAQ